MLETDLEVNDLRVEKTLEAIHNTFEELMTTRPFEKITVTGLCAQARINKKTFYRYYQTLDSLLAEYEDHYATGYIECTAGKRYPEDLLETTKTFLEFSAAQGPMYDAIVCNSMHERLFQKISEGMESERYEKSVPPKGWTDDEWQIYMIGVTSVQWQMYRKWVEGGKSIPLDDLVEIACDFLTKGALATAKHKA